MVLVFLQQVVVCCHNIHVLTDCDGVYRWSIASSQLTNEASSNIVPLPAFFHGHMSLQSAMQSSAALQRQLQSTQAFCVLPWLVMAPGQLGATLAR